MAGDGLAPSFFCRPSKAARPGQTREAFPVLPQRHQPAQPLQASFSKEGLGKVGVRRWAEPPAFHCVELGSAGPFRSRRCCQVGGRSRVGGTRRRFQGQANCAAQMSAPHPPDHEKNEEKNKLESTDALWTNACRQTRRACENATRHGPRRASTHISPKAGGHPI